MPGNRKWWGTVEMARVSLWKENSMFFSLVQNLLDTFSQYIIYIKNIYIFFCATVGSVLCQGWAHGNEQEKSETHF